MKAIFRFPICLAAAVACGCASDAMYSRYSEPYAIFEPEHHMTMQRVVPAIVETIDGAKVSTGGKDPVKPGPRKVAASIPGAADTTVVETTIDAKPCTRYYLGAKRSPERDAKWEVFVTSSERIGECRMPAAS